VAQLNPDRSNWRLNGKVFSQKFFQVMIIQMVHFHFQSYNHQNQILVELQNKQFHILVVAVELLNEIQRFFQVIVKKVHDTLQ